MYKKRRKMINRIWLAILFILLLTNFKLFILVGLIICSYKIFVTLGLNKKMLKGWRIYISGIKGERKVNKSLKKIALKNILLCDVNLCYGDCESQIDNILITKKGIFNIETKNYSGIISIDSNGIWKQISNRGESNINNFAIQALQHRSVLTHILKNKYKINDVIVIANEYTQIIGEEHSKVPIVKIGKLRGYIENFEGFYDEYNLNEINEIIKSHEISFFKRCIKKVKYIIKDNKAVACFLFLFISIFGWIVLSLPNNMSENDNKSKEVPSSIVSVSTIDENINLNDLNANIHINKLSKYEDKVVIDVDITNNNPKDSIELYFLKFSASDDKNKCYELDSYVDNNFMVYGSIKPLEKKQLTLKMKNTNDINISKLMIKYDDMIHNEFEKELRITTI